MMSDSRYSSSVNLRCFQADRLLLYSQYLIQYLKPASEELEKNDIEKSIFFEQHNQSKKKYWIRW